MGKQHWIMQKWSIEQPIGFYSENTDLHKCKSYQTKSENHYSWYTIFIFFTFIMFEIQIKSKN